ncbi:hypothetical protein Sjap_016742 [Stephania japonica]|uniref:Uncharacterized protein n=1 Tax=Stephania japonica TaxID=461633 RepID=A0AAP0NHP0_9MAGN
MSRCFPFPPPGCENNYAKKEGDPLVIESIKFQREREQSKKRREKKRERKEKKREKTVNASIEENYHGQKKRQKIEEQYADFRGGSQKNIEDEGEIMERSGLSEEHGQPAYVLNLCDSSDSMQSSSKKQKLTLRDTEYSHSAVLRFRLPLLKSKGLEASPCGEQHCSTSRSVDIIARDKDYADSGLQKENSCSEIIETVDHDVVEPAATSNCKESESSERDARLRKLIDSWVPPPFQIERSDSEDLEWLFSGRHRVEVKRERAIDGALQKSCSNFLNGSYSCWRAEADVYALPYTVPF